MIECLRSFCLVESKGLAHLAALGLDSMMLRCMIVKIVKLVDPIEMRKTDIFGEKRLVLHTVTYVTYLAHHELESVYTIIFINKGIQQGVAVVATIPAVLLHA